jgi:hypothetical protein
MVKMMVSRVTLLEMGMWKASKNCTIHLASLNSQELWYSSLSHYLATLTCTTFLKSILFVTSSNLLHLSITVTSYIVIYLFIYECCQQLGLGSVVLLRDVQWIKNLKGCGRNWTWPNLRYYTRICLEELRITEKSPAEIVIVPPEFQIQVTSVTTWSSFLHGNCYIIFLEKKYSVIGN